MEHEPSHAKATQTPVKMPRPSVLPLSPRALHTGSADLVSKGLYVTGGNFAGASQGNDLQWSGMREEENRVRREPFLVDETIAVGVITSDKEPYKSRLDLIKSTWAPYFKSFSAFTFEDSSSDCCVYLRKEFPEEADGRSTNLNLAVNGRRKHTI